MGISSLRVTEYYVSCDGDDCNYCDCISNIQSEIHTQRQAIKKAGCYKLKSGKILCKACFEKYKADKSLKVDDAETED